MTELQREIRQLLLGYIRYNGQKLSAGKGLYDRGSGTFGGNGAARILGVIDTKKRYALPAGDKDAVKKCREAFFSMGRQVVLAKAPGVDAVFYTPIFYNPAVLLCEYTGNEMILTVCTARTTTTIINALHAFNAWERRMPDKLESELIPREKTERQLKKEKKKEARQEKRKEKREARHNKLKKKFDGNGIVQDAKEMLSGKQEKPEEHTTEENIAERPRHGK